jgi:hypothetical protein
MFHKLHYLTLMLLVAFPLSADAQQRGRGRDGGQNTQGRQGRQDGHGPQGRHGRPDGDGPRDRRGPQGRQSPRAAALAPPQGLAQALLPAGARRLPTSPANAPYANWRSWPRNRSWDKHRFSGYPFGSYYAVPYSGYSEYEFSQDTYEEPMPAPAAATNKGLLQLMITPASGLDYYIDGIYFGSSSNLGSQFEVNAGARQVEVRASGYKSSTFDTRIDEGQVTTVRGALERMEQPQAPRSEGSRVMYVIPGCYMGNSKPEPRELRPGCDIKRMVTRGPGL